MKAMVSVFVLLILGFSVFSAQQEAASQKQLVAKPVPVNTSVSDRNLVSILTEMVFKNSLDEAFKRDYNLDLKKEYPNYPRPGSKGVSAERSAYEIQLRGWLEANPAFIARFK